MKFIPEIESEKLAKGEKLPFKKACSCGAEHDVLPSIGKLTDMGLWFDCNKCGSSNLINKHLLVKKDHHS